MLKILKCFTLVLAIAIAGQSAKADSFNSGFAVVLIDMQNGFYLRGGVQDTQGLKQLVHNQQRLLEWANGNLIPIIVYEYDFGYGPTDANLMSIVQKGKYKVIIKRQDGAFDDFIAKEQSLETLKKWGVDTLIVAGINGPYCVKSTIMGAMENGFNVITTPYIIGNLNVNPPTFPNGRWTYKDRKLTIFPNLNSIILKGKQ